MTDKQAPPDWVLREAAERSGLNRTPAQLRAGQIANAAKPYFLALCEMIEKYEQPPADRKLLCAREAVRLHNERHVFSHGLHTPEEVCIRAIELWEEGFGK